ncbi:MAG: hypothetical protein ACKVJQ_02990 [Alphaproteobacteria bacterium]|jgi:hypothetical protein
MKKNTNPDPLPLDELGPRSGDENPHELLYRAYLLGWVHFGTKLAVLNRPGSPVFNAYENWGPVGLVVFLSLYTILTSGMAAGFSLLAAGLFACLLILPKWVLKKLRVRVLEMSFGSEQGWRDLWQGGGISMRIAPKSLEEADNVAICDSPDGDWEAFAREHLNRPDNEHP